MKALSALLLHRLVLIRRRYSAYEAQIAIKGAAWADKATTSGRRVW
jgi:hypothetical protein